MSEQGEWTEAALADLETVQSRLAERRDQRASQLEESVERVRTDLEVARSLVREVEDLEERLVQKRRRRGNRQPGTETHQRLGREIRELEQERFKLRRWFSEQCRDIRRELEDVRQELEDAEFSKEVLEGVGTLVR
jgi:hypothetical protein